MTQASLCAGDPMDDPMGRPEDDFGGDPVGRPGNLPGGIHVAASGLNKRREENR